MNPIYTAAIMQQIEELKDRGKNLEMLVKDSQEMALFHFERNQKLSALLTALNYKQTIDRKMWNLIRESLFWEVEVPSYPEIKFKEDFRMCRKTFFELVSTLNCLVKMDTVLRKSIPVDKRVAVSIYYLASSAECRTVSNLFGIGRSTVREIVLEFSEALCAKYERGMFGYFYPPTNESIKEMTDGFEQRWGFPQVYGAVDGCHIEITPSKYDATDYHNYKGWYSIILLAAVDYRYRFTYINVGSPGKNNDSYIYEKSRLKLQHEQHELFYKNSRDICGNSVPVMLLGDSAFKLSRYLMKPYPGNNLQHAEKIFNYMLSRSRRVVENAFGQLKARFRKIGRGLEMLPENACLVIKACCILHNYLNNKNELLSSNVEDDHKNFAANQPTNTTTLGDDNLDGNRIRNTLSEYLYTSREECTDTDGGGDTLDMDEDEDEEAPGSSKNPSSTRLL